MSICGPCREEGKGSFVAHYEGDARRGRPAMCFTHYWEFTGNGGNRNNPVLGPVSQQKPNVVVSPSCSERGCAFPAGLSGVCRQHERVNEMRDDIFADTRPLEPLEQVVVKEEKTPDEPKERTKLGLYIPEKKSEAVALLLSGKSVREKTP